MKHLPVILILAALYPLLHAETIPPYLESSSRLYSFSREYDEIIDSYFDDIKKIREEDPAAAVRNYQILLQKHYSDETVDRGKTVPVSVRVFRIIMNDEELLESFRHQYGETAEREFEKARAAGSIEDIRRVVHLYYPSRAGAQALRYLVLYYIDHGESGIAVYYLKFLSALLPAEEISGLKNIIDTVVSKTTAKQNDKQIDFNSLYLKSPEWIGGISLSTVYPSNIGKYPESEVWYPLFFGEKGVAVNTGSDTYFYEIETGRHLWKPGDWHSVNAGSLLEEQSEGGGDNFGRNRQRSYGRVFKSPAGVIFGSADFVGTVFKGESKSDSFVLFSGKDGNTMTHFTSEMLKQTLAGQIEEDGRNEFFPGFSPAYSDGHLFFTVQVLSGRREYCFLVNYDPEAGKVIWKVKVFDASLLQYRTGRPLESIVNVSGPYVSVFTYSGCVAVFRVFDGVLLWKKSLLPERMTEYGYSGGITSFIPFVSGEHLIIEGPYRNHVSALDLFNGDEIWKTDLSGSPVWGMDAGGNAVACVSNDTGFRIVCLSQTGQLQWDAGGAVAWPGSVSGRTVLLPMKDEIVQLDIASGRQIGAVRPEGCRYPAGVFSGHGRLFLVNNTGLYSYASENH